MGCSGIFLKMNRNSISAIYCDDIRSELGGKVSLMGVYSGDMFFRELPGVLPKLCAHVLLRLPFSRPPKQQIRISLVMDGKAIAEAVMDEVALAATPLPPPDKATPAKDRTLLLAVNLIVPPMGIPHETKIFLEAIVDGRELIGNGLKIRTLST
jgi:hypothetical protein